MGYRIEEYDDGFVVEEECFTWYGRRYWVPFVHARGTGDAWYHESYESAEVSLVNKIKWQTMLNSQ